MDKISTHPNKKYFEKTPPIKLTEGRQIKLNQDGWGLLSDYYLESVKIDYQKNATIMSTAILKVADKSGEITCVIKGLITGHLFNLSINEWSCIEKLCSKNIQLFYRYFKNGVSSSLSPEQKFFYDFCLSNQTSDILVMVFSRCVNMRNKDRNNAVLYVTDLRKCDNFILDIYLKHFREIKFHSKQ